MKIFQAVMAVITLTLSLPPAVRAQNPQPSPDSKRRVVRRVAPQYPEAAKRMGLSGTVKLIAVVGADGSVKKIDAVGGSPLLVQAAETAIAQWKYTPGTESQESVEMRFTP